MRRPALRDTLFAVLRSTSSCQAPYVTECTLASPGGNPWFAWHHDHALPVGRVPQRELRVARSVYGSGTFGGGQTYTPGEGSIPPRVLNSYTRRAGWPAVWTPRRRNPALQRGDRSFGSLPVACAVRSSLPSRTRAVDPPCAQSDRTRISHSLRLMIHNVAPSPTASSSFDRIIQAQWGGARDLGLPRPVGVASPTWPSRGPLHDRPSPSHRE